jgi:hypothetical protein
VLMVRYPRSLFYRVVSLDCLGLHVLYGIERASTDSISCNLIAICMTHQRPNRVSLSIIFTWYQSQVFQSRLAPKTVAIACLETARLKIAPCLARPSIPCCIARSFCRGTDFALFFCHGTESGFHDDVKLRRRIILFCWWHLAEHHHLGESNLG